MNAHPSDEALLAYCERGQHGDEDSAVRVHLDSGCERCRRRVRIYDEILASLRSPGLKAAPENLVQDALDRIRELQGEEGLLEDRVRRATGRLLDGVMQHLRNVQMDLVLDSCLGTVLPGIRSETTLQPRQILFESPEGTVHLQILRKKARTFEVTGQYIPFQGSVQGRSRVILEGEGRRAERKLAATGEFRFSSVRTGRHRLTLECNDLRLAAGPFEIQEDSDA